jgi:maltose alpha-D-glucosyltransferase/alpha-amylase
VSGIHPEAEISRHLTKIGYANTAPLYGEVVRIDPAGVPHTLCILQGFIDNQGDAWNWALDYLRRTIDDLALAVDADDAIPDPEKEAQAIEGYRAMAGIIGKRLGELHVALAAPSDDPAFAPEPATPEQIRAWTEGTQRMLSTALDLLSHRVDQLTDDTKELAQSLLDRREALTKAVAKLVPADAGALRTRIHGDFHLGQVLVAQGDAYLIDFEGEPARTLDERRQKSSPMRDVAGLLRSFSYASAAAQSTTESAPQQTADRKRALFDRFRVYAAESFLGEYRAAVAAAAQPLVAPASEQGLLDLFLIEKAAYEIRYEAANRPTWLGLPVRGLAALASRMLGDTGTPHDTSTPGSSGATPPNPAEGDYE